MSRYSKALLVLAALLACALFTPLPAAAGCPGCEEYTLDIPEDDGGGDVAPAPTPAPTPTAPAPVTGEATTEVVPGAAPIAPAPVVEPEPDKPSDTDPDPVPGSAVKPPELTSIPAVAASQAGRAEGGGSGLSGLLPLGIAMAVIAAGAAAIAIRRGRGTASD